MLRLELSFSLVCLLLRSNALLGQLNGAPRISLDALQISLRLKQCRLGSTQPRFRIYDSAGSLAGGLFFRCTRLRNLMAKAGQHRFRSLAISGEFLRVKHGDGVSGFYFSAFVDGQTLNASADFWADYHLVGVNGADQDKIRRVVGREKIIDGGNHQQQSEKSKEAVALCSWFANLLRGGGSKDGGTNKIEHGSSAGGDPFRRGGIAGMHQLLRGHADEIKNDGADNRSHGLDGIDLAEIAGANAFLDKFFQAAI